MYGWHELEDYSGNLQEYYFENGLVKKGWLTYNSKQYYLSTFDLDNNEYIDCNLLKSQKREIDGVCYEFDSTGIATQIDNCNEEPQQEEPLFDFDGTNTIRGFNPNYAGELPTQLEIGSAHV